MRFKPSWQTTSASLMSYIVGFYHIIIYIYIYTHTYIYMYVYIIYIYMYICMYIYSQMLLEIGSRYGDSTKPNEE